MSVSDDDPGRVCRRADDDPADQLIVATARDRGAVVVTKDDRILDYAHVRAIW